MCYYYSPWALGTCVNDMFCIFCLFCNCDKDQEELCRFRGQAYAFKCKVTAITMIQGSVSSHFPLKMKNCMLYMYSFLCFNLLESLQYHEGQ